MNTLDLLQYSINYAEENLKAEITPQELADRAGFSLSRYYHLFQTAVGIPVMQYLLHRRLLHAIFEISRGASYVDTALAYGFSSYAGFYKAFRRELGYTPSEFLRIGKVSKPYPIILSQEEHLMLTHKQLTDILRHWGLEEHPIRDIYTEGCGHRMENAYYVGTDFVIKYTTTPGTVKKVVALAKTMAATDLFTAEILPSKDGADWVEERQLYFTVFRRLRGRTLRADEFSPATPELSQRLGQHIALLHQALQKVDAVVNEVDLSQQILTWALPRAKQFLSLPEALCREAEHFFAEICPSLPRQIIHRDPNPSNIIVQEERWGFLDFDLSQSNLRLFDPCYAATAILSETDAAQSEESFLQWVTIVQDILHGYDRVVHLTSEEKAAVPFVILAIQLICVAYFSQQEKFRHFFEINLTMTRRIVEQLDRLRFS